MRSKLLSSAALIVGVFTSLVVAQPAGSDAPSGEVSTCQQPVISMQPAMNYPGTLTGGDCFDPTGSYVDIYKIQSSSENTSHRIEITSGAYTPSVRMLSSSGALVATGTQQGSAVRMFASNLVGTYYVFIGSQDPAGTGNYQATYNLTIIDIFPSPRINFDGYSGADTAVYRPSENRWMIRSSEGQVRSVVWGEPGDKLVPSDYDGDGKTDIAVFRPSTGVWHIVESQTGAFRTVAWGQNGDIPIAAKNYQSNKADIRIFRPSEGRFYVRKGFDNEFYTVDWGTAGDIPFCLDSNGFEFVVFRPSEGKWYIYDRYSSSLQTLSWGEDGDIPVPADYDNDGRWDVAVYRPSTGQWFLIKSRYNDIQVTQWGEPGDVPVPDDYYFDGRSDLAVFRPSNARWYVVSFDRTSSIAGSFEFGQPGDLPALAHFYLR